MSTLLTPLALLIYLLLGWHFCQTRLAARAPAVWLPENILLFAGLLLHGAAIFIPIVQHAQLHFGASESLSLTAWLTLIVYVLGRLRWKLDGLEPPLFAFVGCFVLLALLLPTGHAITYAQNTLSRSHFLLAMLAQGLLVNAAAIAILMRFSDRNLHHTAGKLLARTLPPLLTLEQLLFSCVGSGFFLLSAALVTGAFFSEQHTGVAFTLSHKTIFAISSWGIFGTLLFGRFRYGWRGRFAANWTLTGVLFLFLGYIGTRIALEVFLHSG